MHERLSYDDDALAALASALVFGMHPSLDGITALARELGDPQHAFASVQVTGTNGKTSVSRITAALLRAEGHATGLYTSPHLERYPERIEVDGEPLSDDAFALALSHALDAAEALRAQGGFPGGFTEFELLTAAALWAYREAGVAFAVLEVGLGGRWDATSVVSPSVAVITGVGLDHTAILGDTLTAIAAEKAAIIRPASAPVLGPGTAGVERIFLERAEAVATHARAVRAEREASPVPEALTVRFALAERPASPGGRTVVDVRGVHAEYPGLALFAPSYQAANVATAVAAAEAALGRALTLDRARDALAALAIPGRFEVVAGPPPVIVDGSHNPQAALALADAVREAFGTCLPDVLLGILGDKDAEGIVRALAPVARRIHVTASASKRALPAAELAAIVERVTGAAPRTYASVAAALADLAPASEPGLLVTGSITTAGEARTIASAR